MMAGDGICFLNWSGSVLLVFCFCIYKSKKTQETTQTIYTRIMKKKSALIPILHKSDQVQSI